MNPYEHAQQPATPEPPSGLPIAGSPPPAYDPNQGYAPAPAYPPAVSYEHAQPTAYGYEQAQPAGYGQAPQAAPGYGYEQTQPAGYGYEQAHQHSPTALLDMALHRFVAELATDGRRVEVTTRVEVLNPVGGVRAWVPIPLLTNTNYFKRMDDTWIGNYSSVKSVPYDKYTGFVFAEWPAAEKAPKAKAEKPAKGEKAEKAK